LGGDLRPEELAKMPLDAVISEKSSLQAGKKLADAKAALDSTLQRFLQ